MPVLDNPRHEQFAQLVATGKTPAEAYVCAGYAEKTAYTCGPRLLKKAPVRSRVGEFQQTVAKATVTRAAIDREKVLSGLWEIASKGTGESARVRAYELCGKELGMFVDRGELPWDGDPTTLTDQQLEQLTRYLESLAFHGDQAGLEAAKRRFLERAASVIDVAATPVEPSDEIIVPGAD